MSKVDFIFRKLQKHYAPRKGELLFANFPAPFQMLCATLLSARTRDELTLKVARRLELVETTKPEKTEEALAEVVLKRYGREINWSMVIHGKTLCLAHNPRCCDCSLLAVCPFGQKRVGKEKGAR